MFNYLYFT